MPFGPRRRTDRAVPSATTKIRHDWKRTDQLEPHNSPMKPIQPHPQKLALLQMNMCKVTGSILVLLFWIEYIFSPAFHGTWTDMHVQQQNRKISPSTTLLTASTYDDDAPMPPPRILSIFAEPLSTLEVPLSQPLSNRTTNASILKLYQYPQYSILDCTNTTNPLLPINDFPTDDPFLPWIHDYVVEGTNVRFVAQNKRRCETGKGKEGIMRYWENQVALFQGIPLRRDIGTDIFRLWPDASTADAPETRFLCRFHSPERSMTVFSQFDFNYEFVLWRKDKLPMFKTTGKDVSTFELSQLLFSCPIPSQFQSYLSQNQILPQIRLDIVPIRTPARTKPLLYFNHTGSRTNHIFSSSLFDPHVNFGSNHVLPPIRDSGRWANLALCPAKKQIQRSLVACTWTAAAYNRRGDAAKIQDSASRLREWILFHKIVGFEHFYVYDNTELTENEPISPLESIAASLGSDLVTYHRWPARICNNNRPNHPNPGERSSQYAAEASCRVRYGSSTTWMAFLDTDEYMVPSNHTSWQDLLKTKDNFDVLKMRSSRGRPRLKLMVPLEHCETSKLGTDSCLVPRSNETFLRVYNCDYIRPPRPDRFDRAMKQIFRPSEVLSHFVHYSTVTRRIARYYHDDPDEFRKSVTGSDYRDSFLDELTEGSLIHAKTVLPHETTTRASACVNASRHTCPVGYECPATTQFVDALHQKNVFHDEAGQYCNCWPDLNVENSWLPRLEKEIEKFRND